MAFYESSRRNESAVEGNPFDAYPKAAQPPPWQWLRAACDWSARALFTFVVEDIPRLAWIGTVLIVAVLMGRSSVQAIEIGVPLSDPKFPISVFAGSGTKTEQGATTVYQLEEGCRVYQGSFLATCDRATLWVQTVDVEGVTLHRGILQTEGGCQVRWAEDQRLEDQRWMGRLFSRTEVSVSVNVWKETSPQQPPPPLSWTDPPATASPNGVQDAIHWSDADEASFVRLAAQLQSSGQTPPLDGLAPSGAEVGTRTALPNTMTIGNAPLGGTVLDAGTMPWNSENSVPSASGNRVEAFQPPSNLGPIPTGTSPFGTAAGPGPMILDSGPAPLPAPLAMTSPDVRIPTQRVGARTFAFSGRDGVEPQLQTTPRPDRGDTAITITRGIRLMFGDAAIQTSGGSFDLGTILIEADRCIIWTSDMGQLLSRRIDDLPVELYLEGNIVFQQGVRKIYADRMYYNVQSEYGMILGAEVLTPAPQYEGILRLKADVIQQRSRENFLANGAALTSSRLGVPRYWLQADRIELNDKRESTPSGLLGFGLLAPGGAQTGMKAKARNNFVYVEGVPVFYWPVLNSNVDTSSFYVSGAQFRQDRIFGTQALVDFDLYQILGIDAVDGTKWNLSTDYLSERGFALGTDFYYNQPSFFGGGPANGSIDVWGLYDQGLDTLGSDRVDMVPEARTRGRAFLQHRQFLSRDLRSEFWAEVGYITDRNFLEQFMESDWDTLKDRSTALRYRHYFTDEQMLDVSGQVRVNDFFTETEWLPRLDHYLLGYSLGSFATLYGHTNVGYARQRVASFPTAPQDAAKWVYQPWEVTASGVQAATRQEISVPFDVWYSKWTPYLAGEAAYWGEDLNGQSLDRLTGSAGLRSSLPFWRTFPEVQSSLFNVNGLAHKVTFASETWYADTTREIDELPLYDPIDDNSQEHFRRRLIINTFGGALPPQFESNNLAARQGMQRYVSAASSQIVANQLQSRVGLHQRLQTKRGVPGRERIADLVELDVDAIYFYDPERDNFGETWGGINYNFRYHIGDRFTLTSDGYYDTFVDGLHATSFGGILSRPARGELYLGWTAISGPFSSDILTASFNYRLNDKWAAVAGTSYDFGPTGNVGQSLSITRIGESFLFRLGMVYDKGRDNVGLQFAIEPRFLPVLGLGTVGGQVIPPAGLYGLE